jgi:hypothetical protein
VIDLTSTSSSSSSSTAASSGASSGGSGSSSYHFTYIQKKTRPNIDTYFKLWWSVAAPPSHNLLSSARVSVPHSPVDRATLTSGCWGVISLCMVMPCPSMSGSQKGPSLCKSNASARQLSDCHQLVVYWNRLELQSTTYRCSYSMLVCSLQWGGRAFGKFMYHFCFENLCCTAQRLWPV